ncbi:MAG: sigma-70 family RNA polymerase sigma factor [Planctomycetia bacterium]|nr:sigma-70 family RNA polymerase sigma factor [Planctomycetia bacterium]
MNRKDVERLHESVGSEHFADALSLTRDEWAARDIVQNVFAGLLAPGVQPKDPEAYIAVAVRNGVLKWREREAQEREKRALQEPIWVAPEELSERVAALEAALAKLSFDQQQVIQMYFRQGLKKPEIARQLGLPLSTIESRFKHAMERLEEMLTNRIEE